MNLKSLFKLSTTVGWVVCSLLFVNHAYTQAQTSSPQMMSDLGVAAAACEKANNDPNNWGCKVVNSRANADQNREADRSSQRCDELVKNISTEQKKFASSCGSKSCAAKIKACEDEEEKMGMAAYMGGGFGGFDTDCMQMMANAKCPEKNAGKTKDYEDEKKDLTDREKSIKEKIEDLNKEGVELQGKTRDLNRSMESKIKQNDRELQKAQQETMASIEKILFELKSQQTKNVQEARAKFDEFDQQYIQMRDKARRNSSEVVMAKINMSTQCKSEANDMYQKANAELKQQLAEEDKIVKNFVSASRMAGERVTVGKRAERQRAMNFANFYKDCISGSSTRGAQAMEKIASLERKRIDDEKNLEDMARRLESLRQEVTKRVMEAEQELGERRAMALKQHREALESLGKDHQMKGYELQREYADAQQDLMMQGQMLQQRLMTQGQELSKVSMELQMNHGRLQCARMSGGSLKESSADRRLDKYQDAAGALDALVSYCDSLEETCNVPDYRMPAEDKATKVSDQSRSAMKKSLAGTINSCRTYLDRATTAGLREKDDDDDGGDDESIK